MAASGQNVAVVVHRAGDLRLVRAGGAGAGRGRRGGSGPRGSGGIRHPRFLPAPGELNRAPAASGDGPPPPNVSGVTWGARGPKFGGVHGWALPSPLWGSRFGRFTALRGIT